MNRLFANKTSILRISRQLCFLSKQTNTIKVPHQAICHLAPLRNFTRSSITLQQQRQPHEKLSHTFDESQKSISSPHEKLSHTPNESQKSISSPHEKVHIVTKEQLLAKANSVLSRLKVRIKWLLKKSNRPYNTDDYSAFFSWIVVGNIFLFFVATTTFVSLIIFTANTVFAQEFVAKTLGEFITKNSNMTVTFESAIVPGWSDGKISFRKCFVSRRPKKIKKFSKGSQQEAYEKSLKKHEEEEHRHGHGHGLLEGEQYLFEDDGNYTQFDLTIEEVNISLSFNKWVNGTGMIETMEIKGLRGVVDRTHVHWDPDDDARNYKNIYHPGDFEIEDFKMEDVLFELKQPNGFRPFDVAIYNCELSKLRKHWLFYDFLNANVMSGSYDNSLFTVHKKQRLSDFTHQKSDKDLGDLSTQWKRITCLRVDGLNIDHLNTGLEGPFGWITNGKVDMLGEIMVPQEHNEVSVTEIVNSIANSIKREATRYRNPEVHDKHPDMHTRLTSDDYTDITKYFVLDLTIRLNNVRASVPFKAPELSYVNYALIRPIVAYINSKNTFIEIHNRIVKNIQDFNGSWTVYDSLLMDDISEEVYDNFVEYVVDEEARIMRVRRVGFWSLQLFLQVILLGIGALA
ncbi:MDM31 [Candida oxycetoniae]|uniref:MDM31 n=1 Tax=Candida oxycetoniae TaxID=497107 RepID=A0AAI9SSN0_9ASCO|nr:MDM31 [Candida oxycetoniae]KAI3402440.2 MDM31 [Candida oxycetoniae]